MAGSLPFPVVFRLPGEWRPVPPDAVGVAGAAFVALLPDPDDGWTANVTVDGERGPASLEALAGRSVESLRAALGGDPAAVTVLDRDRVGTAIAPALTQTLSLVDRDQRRLVQAQVYLALPDTTHPARSAVIRLVLTATAAQARAALPDFRWFVSTVRPGPARSDAD